MPPMRATALLKPEAEPVWRAVHRRQHRSGQGATAPAMPMAITRMAGKNVRPIIRPQVSMRSISRKPPATTNGPSDKGRRGPMRPASAPIMGEASATTAAKGNSAAPASVAVIADGADQHIGHQHQQRAQRAIKQQGQQGKADKKFASRTAQAASSRARPGVSPPARMKQAAGRRPPEAKAPPATSRPRPSRWSGPR